MGENLTNIERFPNNIFVPDRVNIKGNEYIRYRAYFRGLDDVQKYLMPANVEVPEAITIFESNIN